jgi:hypothetical protein
MSQGGDPEPMRDNHRTGIGAMGENFKEKSDAEREAEQFTANLKQSIKQWMSAQ